MPGEGEPEAGGVDVDDAALGVVDEHGLTEAQLGGEGLPRRPVGKGAGVADDAEGVAVAAVRAAEDLKYVEHVALVHPDIEASHFKPVTADCAKRRSTAWLMR